MLVLLREYEMAMRKLHDGEKDEAKINDTKKRYITLRLVIEGNGISLTPYNSLHCVMSIYEQCECPRFFVFGTPLYSRLSLFFNDEAARTKLQS